MKKLFTCKPPVYFPAKDCVLKSLYHSLGIFTALLLIFILFFKSPILDVGHMTVLRLIRSMIFTWIVCGFLYTILGTNKLKDSTLRSKWIACLSWTGIWTGIYTIVFSRVPDLLQHDIGNYYLVPCLFFSVSLLVTIGISKAHNFIQKILSFTYSLFIFLMLLSPIFYAFYFMIYGQEFDEYALLSVIATNPDEIVNYLTATFSSIQLILILLSLFLLFTVIYIITLKTTARRYSLDFKNRTTIIFTILSFFFFFNYIITVFPIDQALHLRRLNGPMNAFIQLQNNIEQNNNNLIIETPNTLASKKTPGSIIIVIGESANRDMMSAFTPSYDKNTTPWEKSVRDDQNFIFFDNSFANFPNTVMAVTQALTSSNQYNNIPLKDSIDLLDVARKAGYHTYWLSLQNKSTVSDAGITVIANRADTIKWLHGYDETILSELKNIPSSDNNFIIIHLNGSHFRYDRRIPQEFIEKNTLPTESKTDWYNASLQYTDYVLKEIYQYGKENLHMQALVYFSDHGENMEYTHTSSPFYFDMVHIPFWIYLSPEYQAAYPGTYQSSRNNEKEIFTNDLMFESISGILHAESNSYQPEYDITSSRYNLSIDHALTLHGKKYIRDDIK